MNNELADVQAEFRKGRGTRDQIASIRWITENARVSEKHLLLLYWICQSICVDHNKLWNIPKEMGMPDHLICLLRNLEVKKQQLKPDMEQQIGSKLGKEYVHAVYCHLAYLTYMQSTSWEILAWMKHKLGKIARRNINNLRCADDNTLMAESKEELKSVLMKVEEESEKVDLKFNIQKTMMSDTLWTRWWHLVPSLHGK